MIPNQKLFFLVLLIPIVKSTFQLYFVNELEAKCLDGSPGSFYFERGTEHHKFLIHFEGGGFEGGYDLDELLRNCYHRSKTNLGSSKYLRQQSEFDGILSKDKTVNPDLYSWNKIRINYCDGQLYSSYHKNSYHYEDREIYFRGQTIIKSFIEQFKQQFPNATEILVSGASAGGVATYIWANYFREQFPEHVRINFAPDSGIFPYIDFGEFTSFFFEEASPPNKKCSKKYPNNLIYCLNAGFLIEFIDEPLFIIESQYDSYTIQNFDEIDCVYNRSLERCSSQQRDIIEAERQETLSIISQAIQTHPTWGFWVPSCIRHVFSESKNSYNSKNYQIPFDSGNTLQASLSRWLSNQQDQSNNIHIDPDGWPSNQKC